VSFTGQSGAKWTYWTDQPLGAPGGFGTVYAAEAEDGTAMAVKEVQKRAGLDDRLLLRETDIGKRVTDSGHDMLLPVLDSADAGTALLLVMARAEQALAKLGSPMDESQVMTVMSDIATGLQQLHSIGILHRDLKPANTLRHDGRWKLADFGIARDQEIGTQSPTWIGAGSPPYMAPEIWELKSPTVKSDLYALGCLGFELLSGAPPYTGTRDAIRAGHLTQAPPEVPSSNIALKSLITRLIAKDPGERPQDARAVLDRLQRAVLPRSPVQEAIAHGLSAHDAAKARAAAESAAAKAATDLRNQQITQAKADLREILADALEELQTVEPDADLQDLDRVGSRWVAGTRLTLSAGEVQLRIDLWQDMTTDRPIPDDTMILAGCVTISNPAHPTQLNSANIVYEQASDRLAWQIYKFQSSWAQPNNYPYGPYGRTHGLRHGEFYNSQQRSYMIHSPGMHVWKKTTAALTPRTALELFREAVDLRPPDPRTGIWPSTN
jgi:serine/threonine protein kinase